MAKIKITIQDDFGKVITETADREYQLDLGKATLTEIEEAVEGFKKRALADIEKDFLYDAQTRFVQEQKKSGVLKCNGTTTVTIKTLHGKFPFALQRLSIEACEGSSFDFTGQCLERYTSQRLKEFSAYYSNRLSYEEVESLIERQTGEKLLSDQKIGQIVVAKAVCVSEQLRQEVQSVLDAVQMPVINPRVDIDDPNQTEILLLEEAIQVKEQKQTREKCPSQDGARATGSRVSTDVMMLKADGGFHYLTAGIDAQGEPTVPLADIVRAKIAEEYGTTQAVLNIVAITDGAQAIRSRFVAIFGMAITLILDWYHLEKKVPG